MWGALEPLMRRRHLSFLKTRSRLHSETDVISEITFISPFGSSGSIDSWGDSFSKEEKTPVILSCCFLSDAEPNEH